MKTVKKKKLRLTSALNADLSISQRFDERVTISKPIVERVFNDRLFLLMVLGSLEGDWVF